MVKVFDKKMEFDLIEKGTYPARIYSIIHVGNIEGYQGMVQDKVKLTFELPTELKVFKEENGEQPRVISADYTVSFNEKANLKQIADACGITARIDEETGFDYIELEDFIGKPCLVQIGTKVSAKGREFNTIENVTSPMKGQVIPEQINKTQFFTVQEFNQDVFNTFPDFIKEKIVSSREYKKQFEIEEEVPFN